ncbi:MAG: helix-turn-helix domain-containing protein [Candidatus Latescibacterota bacterium]|nr:MAG: helix-turn-helix domain-containing protein [Candidatus Latescibacterota bacterium]
MAVLWPRPQRLLPPKLLDALEAAQAGDAERALRLVGGKDGSDPLTADVVRLVRGLAAAESGEDTRALRLLRPLLRARDESVALAATLASVELQMRLRGFARAAPWIERARRHATDEATTLLLESAALRLQLLRSGSLDPDAVRVLQNRLLRRHPPAVHASVHLVEAERALFAGDLAGAGLAERTARPHVASSKLAALRRQHEVLAALLHDVPVAEVEDWERPRRPMNRAEIAELQQEGWQVWIDWLHRRLRYRARVRDVPLVVHFASHEMEWALLSALARSPRRRLTAAQAARALRVESVAAVERLTRSLQSVLDRHGAAEVLGVQGSTCTLRPKRFVHLVAAEPLPAALEQLLAFLGAQPGARTSELQRVLHVPASTLRRRLLSLRNRGLVRLVGGGSEARYHAV